VEKTKILSLVSVYLYSCLSYPPCKSHLFCVILYRHMWPVWMWGNFPRYLINSTIFEGKKKLSNIKCASDVYWTVHHCDI